MLQRCMAIWTSAYLLLDGIEQLAAHIWRCSETCRSQLITPAFEAAVCESPHALPGLDKAYARALIMTSDLPDESPFSTFLFSSLPKDKMLSAHGPQQLRSGLPGPECAPRLTLNNFADGATAMVLRTGVRCGVRTTQPVNRYTEAICDQSHRSWLRQ